MRPRDTSVEAHQVQLAIYRRMTRSERFALAGEMSDAVRALAAAGIRHRHPDYSDADAANATLRLMRWRNADAVPESGIGANP